MLYHGLVSPKEKTLQGKSMPGSWLLVLCFLHCAFITRVIVGFVTSISITLGSITKSMAQG